MGWGSDCVPTLKNGSTIGIPSPPAILLTNGEIVTPDIRDAERLQGLPANWTKPAQSVARQSSRWSLIGNAVTTPVAGWIGRRLMKPTSYDRSRDVGPVAQGDWPRAARFDGASRREVRISGFPCWRKRKPLEEFLLYPPFLLYEERATAGFLSAYREKLSERNSYWVSRSEFGIIFSTSERSTSFPAEQLRPSLLNETAPLRATHGSREIGSDAPHSSGGHAS